MSTIITPSYASTVAIYNAGNGPTANDPQSIAGGSWSIDPSGGVPAPSMFGPVIDAGVPAWRITDLTALGGLLSYRSTLDPLQLTQAETLGWEYEIDLRMTTGGSGSDFFSASIYAGVVLPGGRWDLYVDVDTAGALNLVQFVGDTRIIHRGPVGLGTNDYNNIIVRLAAGETTADVLLNGIKVGTLPDSGIGPDLPAGIRWGAGSSFGTGEAYFRSVELRILPTPGTTSIVVIAGLFASRRRR